MFVNLLIYMHFIVVQFLSGAKKTFMKWALSAAAPNQFTDLSTLPVDEIFKLADAPLLAGVLAESPRR
jgi:hypothetical protein